MGWERRRKEGSKRQIQGPVFSVEYRLVLWLADLPGVGLGKSRLVCGS